MLAGMFLSLVFVFGFAVSSFGGLTPEAETQRERLRELMHGTAVVPFSLDEDFIVPRVNMIAAPEGDRSYFLIGVESEPTQECIEFILYYTGIPRENAYIGKSWFELQILPYDPAVISPAQEIEPFSYRAWNMGQMITIQGVGTLTMGHPHHSGLTSFVTAPHRHGLRGNNVSANSLTIGTVNRSVFNVNADVAIIDLHDRNTVSPHVDGGVINNFTARASRRDSVVSIRGMSGIQRDLWVEGTDFEIPGRPMRNMIGIYPDRNSTGGDSGSALIRRMSPTDRAVLGTRAGRLWFVGRYIGIYTPVVNY